MSSRVASIVLLVEDSRQEILIRSYLLKIGHHTRSIRVVRLTPGKGSGEQFVRERYASEVRAIRQQFAKTKACLIAMIDADIEPLENRVRQFEKALKDADESPRKSSEAIVHLIPKRNVETWILCLELEPTEEQSSFRDDKRIDSQLIKKAALTLFDWTRNNAFIPDVCTPSLKSCLPEFNRIPPL